MTLNAVTHIEWGSANALGLKDFLTGLFGWQFQLFAAGYYVYNPPGGAGASVGVMQNERAGSAGSPCAYVTVASIDETMARAQLLGGGVAVPKTAMGPAGSLAVLTAPDGNLVGLHELAGGA